MKVIKRAYRRYMKQLIEYLVEHEQDMVEGDFALTEFLDKVGPRLHYLSSLYSNVEQFTKPKGEAGASKQSPVGLRKVCQLCNRSEATVETLEVLQGSAGSSVLICESCAEKLPKAWESPPKEWNALQPFLEGRLREIGKGVGIDVEASRSSTGILTLKLTHTPTQVNVQCESAKSVDLITFDDVISSI